MAHYVALLRGINVGKAKRIAMADLRAIMMDLGCANVRTLLNSGNVVFDAPHATGGNLAGRIEKAVKATLGISSRVTVLTAAELAAIVDDNSLGKVADNPSRLLVTVVTTPADLARVKPLMKQRWTPEALGIGAQAAYMWCPGGTLESRLAASVNRVLGDGTTARNWATILKLNALAAGGD